MARITDPSFKFWYDEKWYSVQGAETMARIGTKDDMSTMRSEYTRMRDAAQKRIARLQKVFPEAKAGQHRYDTGKVDKEGNPIYKSGFPTLKSLDPRDFPKAFAELAKFLNAKSSTVSGQKRIKEKTINTWKNQGLNLNNENYDRVIKILERMRNEKIIYGSDKVVGLADITLNLEINDMQLRDWLDHLDTLLPNVDELQEIPDLRGYDFDEVLSMIRD